MPVVDVETIPVEVGVSALEDGGIAPYRGNQTAVERVTRLLIRITTDDGIEGWGEVRPTLAIESAAQIIERDIAPHVVDRPVWEIEAFLSQFEFEYLHLRSFVAGVEMALWDALGRQLEVPVHRLLGGKCTDAIPVAAPLGILPPEESRRYARRALESGYEVLKTKAGRDWQTDVDRVIAMHDEVDGALEFRVDPNQGWTVEEAVRVMARLEDRGIYLQYAEQPIRIDSIGSLGRLRSRVKTPIAVNEDTYVPRNLFQLIKADAIDVAVVDLVPAGGILELKRLVGVASEAGLSLAHHDGFDLGIKKAAVAHAVASSPAINLATDTVYPAWEDHIIDPPLTVTDGHLTVPDGPGLGISVDVEKLESLRID
ncbi:MAG: mandelate racemase/muconate lactonizing enzyme family protein [Natronomonas sp.]